jgi:hypothetical protein
MNRVLRIVRAVILAFLVFVVPCAGVLAGPDLPSRWVTLSGRAVILPGENLTNLRLAPPACGAQKEFLVLGLEVSPEVAVGATSISVVNLPTWAASVPVFQHFASGVTIQVPLTVIGHGPNHLSVTLPAGQSSGTAGTGSPIHVVISLLGGTSATHRFEFNAHVTGSCGDASLLASP